MIFLERLRSVYVGRGDEFLGWVSVPRLQRRVLKAETHKERLRLQAALLRRQGKTLEEIARAVGKPFNTVSDWLRRIENDGITVVADKQRSGRPKKLSVQQLKKLQKDLLQKPSAFGFAEGFWSTKLVQEHVHKKLGVQFVNRHMTRLLHRMGFSCKKPRPAHYKADKAAQNRFKKNFTGWFPNT